MAKPKKESVKKLQGFHVQKNGIDFKIVIEDLRIIVIRTNTEEGREVSAPRVFYWDWAEVGEKLSSNVSGPDPADTLPAKLEPDPAQRRSIPGTGDDAVGGVSSTK